MGWSKNINDLTKAKISFAIYDFDKLNEFSPSVITFNGKNFGNSLDDNGNYLYDFSLKNLSLEIKTSLMSMPATFFWIWLRTQMQIRMIAASNLD